MKKTRLICAALIGFGAVTAALAGNPSNKQIAWQFAEAVRDGSDPALAGAIPVTADQRDALKLLQGCKFRRSQISTKTRSVFMWICPDESDDDQSLTEVYFDQDRAIRIEISKAVVR